METVPWLVYIFTFLFGIVFGSFLNVCIYRIPEKQSIVTVPSHCMTCGKKLHWYELIPLFSWLALRGKCHGCKSKISPQYPLIEAANGLLCVLALFVKGLTADCIITCLL
ncbi:MAG: prepilin peptidase, partial [Clostridia bacterium]|nr:prepilin peptidase [Clostridia bacterium]